MIGYVLATANVTLGLIAMASGNLVAATFLLGSGLFCGAATRYANRSKS